MPFKFEKLEVWQLSLEYTDAAYAIAAQLPEQERFNLTSQLRRAATSVSLSIAEGSTGQKNAEQARFLGLAIRSLIETVACIHLIQRREYLDSLSELRDLYRRADQLAAKLQKFRSSISSDQKWLREDQPQYRIETD